MRQIALLFVLCAVVGCGGGGNSGVGNPLSGSYSGTYYDSAARPIGSASGSIAGDGSTTFSILKNPDGAQARLSGTTNMAGEFSGTMTVSSGSGTATGTVGTSHGSLVCSITYIDPTVHNQVFFQIEATKH